MTFASALQTFFEPWTVFLADDPLLRLVQIAMLLGGVIAVFLVFYTTRDILLRSTSFFYMFISILVVALLPLVGFFLYLLIRPPRTLKEREMEQMLRTLVEKGGQKAEDRGQKGGSKGRGRKKAASASAKKKDSAESS